MENDLKSVAESLSGKSVDIIPYIDYLLQDLWELGTDAAHVAAMFRTYLPLPFAERSVLDLGCGKGAVSIRIAKELGCKVDGFDLFPIFIDHCQKLSKEHGVFGQCSFTVQDIRQVVERGLRYDAVVYGALGNVFGDTVSKLGKLKQTVAEKGLLYLDEAYQESGNDYPTYESWIEAFQQQNLTLIEAHEPSLDEISAVNWENQRKIEYRADQLIAKNPAIASLIEDYVESQRLECIELETDIKPVCWLLRS